jgi:Recombinase
MRLKAAPVLAELKGAGMSAREMAAELAARGIATPNGGRWHAQSVLRMMERVV